MTKKILIVEDDAFLLDAYQVKMAVQPDWHVSTAVDGKDALDKINEIMPDLIILDLLMPKKSGLEVLDELRKNDKTKKIPVVVASNVDQKKIVQQALRLGAVDYFVKSDVTITELIAQCEQYL